MDDFIERLAALERAAIALVVAALLIMLMVSVIRAYHKRFPKASRLRVVSDNRADGIIFGRACPGVLACSPSAAEGHIAVFGGSGLGKTSALLIPTLRAWQGAALTIDISGDICSNIPGDKLVFTPLESDNSCCYSPFYRIDLLEDEADQDEALEQLAYLLMPRPVGQTSDSSAFFSTEGRKILIAALLAGYHSGQDFVDICRNIVSLSWKDLFSEIDKAKYQLASSYINPFFGANEKNTAGCKQAVDEAVSLFARNRRVRDALHRPAPGELCYTPPCLERKKVFIIIPDEAIEQLSPLLHLITAQTLEYISMRPLDAQMPILLALDEFASLGHLDITPALRKARKRHTRIMILTQSMADLDLIYGKEERASMMANFAFKAVLGAADTDTQEYFSKLIGMADKAKESNTMSGLSPSSRTITTEQRYAIEPCSLANLGDYLILLHPGGYTRLRKAFYFKRY